MPALDHVSIHGPTLAVLLQSVLTSGRCCDGLLFGSVTTAQSVQADDAVDAVYTVEHSGLVSGTLACCSTGSFYNGAGDIDAARLQKIRSGAVVAPKGPSAASQQLPDLLGWFSYRPGTIEQPSMREVAVTAALQQHLAQSTATSAAGAGAAPSQQQPVVFLLITSGHQHGGATLHLSYCAYQLPSSHPGSRPQGQGGANAACGPLHAVELSVINLGKVLSAAHHGCSPFQAPALAAALSCAAPLPPAAERRLKEAAAAAAGAAGDAAEAVCDALLSELQELSNKVGASSAELSAAKERNDRLVQKVMRQMKLTQA